MICRTTTRWASSTKTPGPVGRVARDLLLPIVFKALVTDRSLAWIHHHHIDWETVPDAAASVSGR